MTSWLKCIDEARGKEAHAGPTSVHEGTRALTGKILRMGIYSPTIHQNVSEITRKCVECEAYSPVQGVPLDAPDKHF